MFVGMGLSWYVEIETFPKFGTLEKLMGLKILR